MPRAAFFAAPTRLLADTDVLIIEVEERPFWDGDPWLRPTVVEYLHGHGLRPVARDLQSRFQHNIVFIREALAERTDVRARLDRWAHDVSDAQRGTTSAELSVVENPGSWRIR